MEYEYINPDEITNDEIATLLTKAYEKWTKPKKRLAKDANVLLELAYLQLMKGGRDKANEHLSQVATLKQEVEEHHDMKLRDGQSI